MSAEEPQTAPITVPGLDAQVHMMGTAPGTNVIGGGLVFRRPADLPVTELVSRIKARVHSTLDLPPGMRSVAVPIPQAEPFHALIGDQPVDLDAHLDVRGIDTTVSLERARDLALISMETPLNMNRPLWGMTLVPAIEGDLALIFMKVHHFIQDGVLGLAAAISLLIDAAPDAGLRTPPETKKVARPSQEQIRAASQELLNRRYDLVIAPLEGLLQPTKPSTDSLAGTVRDGVSDPIGTASSLGFGFMRRAKEAVDAVKGSDLSQKWADAVKDAHEFTDIYLKEIAVKPSELLARRSDDRGIAVVEVPRDSVTSCQDVLGEHVSFNDVAVTATVLALREILPPEAREESLVIDVPVSLSLQTGGEQQFDSAAAMMVLQVPLSGDDPAELMRLVHSQSKERKSRDAKTMARMMQKAAVLPLREYKEATGRLWSRGNLFLSNLPGPDHPFFLAGNEVIGAFGLGQLRGHSALRVIIVSYADKATWSLMYDRQVLDGQALADAIPAAVERIAAIGASPQGT